MTLKNISSAALAAVLLTPLAFGPAFATDEIVVVGTLTPITAADLGASVTRIRGDQIAARNPEFVSDLLRDVPSVAVSRNGPQGAFTQIRIRGAEADHTLTLLDGMELGDPAVGGGFDYGTLPTYAIADIEVLRGAGSAIHGSDALGGVIAITTADPTHDTRIEAEAGGGSLGTWMGGAALQGALAPGARARLSISHFNTDGENASNTGHEADGSKTTNANGKAIFNLSPRTALQFAGRYATTETQIDDFVDFFSGGAGLEDADHVNQMDALGGKLTLTHTPTPNEWQLQADVEASRADLDFFDTGRFERGTRGQRQKYGAQVTRHLTLGNFTGRVERERQSFTNIDVSLAAANQSKTKSATSYSAEAQLFPTDAISLQLGVRHDDNNSFDDATTWRASGAWDMPHFTAMPLTLHASAGTGVKDPSFFETFGFFPNQFVGNPALKPEMALNREIGLSGALHEGAVGFDITAFWLDVEDLIKTNFFCAANCNDADYLNDVYFSTPVNLPGKAKANGVEVSVNAILPHGVQLAGHYSFLDAKQANHQQQIRRPRHTASANLTAPFHAGRGLIDLGVDYTGKQQDDDFITFSGNRFTLPSYWLANIAVQFALTDQVTLFARGQNLLDEQYEDVFTYNTPGRTIFAGLRAKLGQQ